MKAQLMSDIHSEFYRLPLEFLKSLQFESNLDFLLLPGDLVVPCIQGEEVTRDVLNFLSVQARHCIFTTGNHCYYHGTFVGTHAILMKAMPPNFHWLRNSDETIEGIHFFGGTLWFPRDEMNHWYERQLNDFNLIPGFRDWVYEENEAFAREAAQLVRPDTVVLSHHIPSEEAVHKNYKGDSFNRFFVSDLTGLIKEKKPRLWVYGHTHLPNRTLVGETDIVTNPYGYPQEREFFPEYEPVVMEI